MHNRFESDIEQNYLFMWKRISHCSPMIAREIYIKQIQGHQDYMEAKMNAATICKDLEYMIFGSGTDT